MPQEWVSPQIYLEHGGYIVYHLYKNDDITQPPREYGYTLWELANEIGGKDEGNFDVRELPQVAGVDVNTAEGRQIIIKAAIDAGYFDDWENEEGESFRTPAGDIAEASKASYTWEKLAEDIAELTPEQRKCGVRFREPYDEAATLSGDGLATGDGAPYLY